MNRLELSQIENIGPKTKRILEPNEMQWCLFQLNAPNSCRFKFKLQDDNAFNHNVYADTSQIDCEPVLHSVDDGSNF